MRPSTPVRPTSRGGRTQGADAAGRGHRVRPGVSAGARAFDLPPRRAAAGLARRNRQRRSGDRGRQLACEDVVRGPRLLPELVWVEDATTNSQALLEGVADGTIDYTIADSTEFAFAHDAHPDLRIAFDFPGSQSLAWAASNRYPEFLQDMREYFASLERGRRAGGDRQALLRPLGGRGVRRGAGVHAGPAKPAAALQAVVRRGGAAKQPGLAFARGDRLSGIEVESERRLGVGCARIDATDRDVCHRREGREPGRPAAEHFRRCALFQQVYEKIPSHVPEPDRTWFALAAYNIGYGHLEDARVLAQKAGRDPDSWEDVRTSCRCSRRSAGIRRRRTATREAGSRCGTWTTSAATSTCSNG